MIYAPRRLCRRSDRGARGFIAGGSNALLPACCWCVARRWRRCLARMAGRVDGPGRRGRSGDATPSAGRHASTDAGMTSSVRYLPAAALILTALALTSFRAPGAVFLIWAMVAAEEGAVRLVLRDGFSGVPWSNQHPGPSSLAGRARLQTRGPCWKATSHRLPRQPGCLRRARA